MTILYALQLLALGFMVAGLVAIILEIAVKSPRAFGEIATDTERFATVPVEPARAAKALPAGTGQAQVRAAHAASASSRHRKAA